MPLSPQAEDLIDAFGRRSDVTPEQPRNLRSAIEASPRLAAQFGAVAKTAWLQRITPLHDSQAAGRYDYRLREIRLHPNLLATRPDGSFDHGLAISVLAHELQHGPNSVTREEALSQAGKEIEAIASSLGAEHDYTAAIGKYIAACRRDEAMAEIASWNAMISAEHKKAEDRRGPLPSLRSIFWMHPRARVYLEEDFGQKPVACRLKPNLELTGDLYMVASARNVEGMAQNYLDGVATLGHHGNSNYPDLYAARAISLAARAELEHASSRGGVPATIMRIDMERLGLSPRIVAENGVDLGGGVQSMPYLDGSVWPPLRATLWHTALSHDYPPAGPCLDHVGHPGNDLYRQAASALCLGNVAIACHAGGYANLAAALAVEARRNDMESIHEVIPSDDGSEAVAVWNRRSIRRKTATVDIAQAVGTSIEQSSGQWQELQQKRDWPVAVFQHEGRDGSDRPGPVRAMTLPGRTA